MKLMSAHIETLKTLYISNLKKALDLEQQIINALPDMIGAATDSELKSAFTNHLQETHGHATKVESLLVQHTGKNSTETCKVMKGLAAETSDTIKDVTASTVLDIALIGGAQQVEHHEIAVYGTLRRWATLLNLPEDAEVLKSIEDEEGKADKLLTTIAEKVNSEA